MEVNLPPLRERQEDITLLVEHFIKKYNREFNKNITGISQNVRKLFMTYHWPGNIRELEHTIEHAFILTDQSTITIEVLPPVFKNLPSIKQKPDICSTTTEAVDIREALEKTGWKKAKAARLLDIDRATIYRKMKKFNIPL
jgi:transcriptional regulator with PAS, ATPase and Fis domain